MSNFKLRRMTNKISYKLNIINIGGKIIFLIISALVLISVCFYSMNLKPMLYEFGSARASYIGQNVINASVENVFSNNDALGNDILNIEKDTNGKITAVMPDLKEMNRLKAKIAVEIAEQMKKNENSKIRIPLGNLTGIPNLSNIGPKITFDLIPYGKTHIDFKTSFTEAGINQIRHQISVEVTLTVSLLISDNQATSTKVTTTIPVCETIVVGDVPQSYTNFITDEQNQRDDAVNMLD